MKTKAALALSLTGILLTGSTALAATSPALNNSHTGISDDVKKVHVTDDSAIRTPAPSPAGVVSEAVPKVATKASDDEKADDKKASAARNDAGPPEPGDDNGGLSTAQTFTGSGTAVTPEPGDDNGGLRTTPEPGDDNGGLRSAQAPQTAQGSDGKGGPPKTPELGDDKGGLRKAPEPGDDGGGHGGRGSGSDD
jgi:hypothetical protein